MRIRGVCLNSIEAQRASGKDTLIDPAVVEFDPERWYQLTDGFDGAGLNAPPVIGRVRIRKESDRLIAEGDLTGKPADGAVYFAVSCVGKYSGSRVEDPPIIVTEATLTSVALTAANKDTGIPPFEQLAA